MSPGIVVAVVLAAWPVVAVAQVEAPSPPPPSPSPPPDRDTPVDKPAPPPESAPASDNVPGVASETIAVDSGPIGSSARGGAMDWLVMPSGYDISGALRYAMSPAGALSPRPLRFTDLGFLDLGARFALGGGAELAVATTLVPKQPSDSDEPVWQGSSLGLRWQPSRKQRYVLGIATSGGPMLDDLGYWGQGGLSIASRKRLIGASDGGIQFEGALAVDGTVLRPSGGDLTSLAEARLDLGVLFHAGKPGRNGGGFATWLSSSYALPVWHHGDDPVSMLELDPQSRLSFAIGMMGSLLDTWDLIVELRATDRGDLEFAATRLPILDGGFDLRQVLFGVTYHGRYPTKHKPPQRDPLIMIP